MNSLKIDGNAKFGYDYEKMEENVTKRKKKLLNYFNFF